MGVLKKVLKGVQSGGDYVPYNGATEDVNLGSNNLTAAKIARGTTDFPAIDTIGEGLTTGASLDGVTQTTRTSRSRTGNAELNFIVNHLHSASSWIKSLFLRSNGDTSTHVSVTNGQIVSGNYYAGRYQSGETGSYYLCAEEEHGIDDTGTISATSMPGKIVRKITPDGSKTPVAFETVRNDGSIDRADKVTKKSTLQDYAEKQTDVAATATTTLDIEDGNVFKLTQDTNITTLNFDNPSPSGNACSFTIIRVKDNSGTARTIAWPAAVKWANGGVAPVLSSSANAVDIFSFVTIDAGTTWYGFVGGVNFA